jgi:formylglycine-generating enzyme required for sulfatase activity
MGVYEVTQAEYERVMGNNPSEFSPKGRSAAAVKGVDTARFPVESICWENAMEFCRRLSRLPEESNKGRIYRLPTEAEWEYGCKAGTTGPNPWDEVNLAKDAWFLPERFAPSKPHPVGLKRPNPWGLYDMLGNELERCSDWFAADYYAKSPFVDPTGPSSETNRVSRGGCYAFAAIGCRWTYRYPTPPTLVHPSEGFRIVLGEWAGGRSPQTTVSAEPTGPSAAAGPPPAVAPFDVPEARKHQEQWTRHLGVPLQCANSIGMKFVLIPPGEFHMGSTPEEVDDVLAQVAAKKHDRWFADLARGEKPRHWVRISKPLYFGVYEVTQAEYERVMGYNPSEFSPKGKSAAAVKGQDTARLPVDSVSWSDAADFCRTLSGLPEEKSKGRVYRLPTEAEWEYAYKGGAIGVNLWDEASLGEEAWFQSNSGGKSHPVGLKRPNAWGLHDMLGNVFEWCSDWVADDYYGESPLSDPTGPSSGLYRAHRGGYFGHPAISCRYAYRHKGPSEQFTSANGMRVVLSAWSVPPSSENAQPAAGGAAKR